MKTPFLKIIRKSEINCIFAFFTPLQQKGQNEIMGIRTARLFAKPLFAKTRQSEALLSNAVRERNLSLG
jgi:hypothetical protein